MSETVTTTLSATSDRCIVFGVYDPPAIREWLALGRWLDALDAGEATRPIFGLLWVPERPSEDEP